MLFLYCAFPALVHPPLKPDQVLVKGVVQNAIVTVFGETVVTPLMVTEVVALLAVLVLTGATSNAQPLVLIVGLTTYTMPDMPFVFPAATDTTRLGPTHVPLKRHQKMPKVWLLFPAGLDAVAQAWPPAVVTDIEFAPSAPLYWANITIKSPTCAPPGDVIVTVGPGLV